MDLVPGYREFGPPPGLREAVACVWVRVPGAVETVRVMPDACVDVVWRRGHGATVAGPDTTAKLVTAAADEVLVGLRFRPGAGGGALGLPLHELTDLRVEVADVDKAYDVPAHAAPEVVAGALLRAVAGRRGDPLVQAAVDRLRTHDVRAVAMTFGVSERQLRRRFHAAVGYGPKTLARVLRFTTVLDHIDHGATDLAALALDAGYADQAHMTRDCTRLSGLPPAQLMRARAALRPAAGTGARPTR